MRECCFDQFCIYSPQLLFLCIFWFSPACYFWSMSRASCINIKILYLGVFCLTRGRGITFFWIFFFLWFFFFIWFCFLIWFFFFIVIFVYISRYCNLCRKWTTSFFTVTVTVNLYFFDGSPISLVLKTSKKNERIMA